jgi:NAD(P)-dependent dehydrogenase (short-subunit alcohol dehydrogenase family)
MSLDFQSLFGLSGRIALVTGASSGIGLHTARLHAQAGATVVLAARRVDRIEATAAELRASGHCAIAVLLDVTRAETIAPAFDAIGQALGRAPDIVVNNAGVGMVKRYLDQTDADVAKVFDTNLKGAYLVGQEAARRMATQGGGVILNIASISGLRTAGWMSSYAASKAGLIQLSGVMALELAARKIPCQHAVPGQHRHRHAGRAEGLCRDADQAHADASAWTARGPRRRLAAAGVRCGALHDGCGGDGRRGQHARVDAMLATIRTTPSRG